MLPAKSPQSQGVARLQCVIHLAVLSLRLHNLFRQADLNPDIRLDLISEHAGKPAGVTSMGGGKKPRVINFTPPPIVYCIQNDCLQQGFPVKPATPVNVELYDLSAALREEVRTDAWSKATRSSACPWPTVSEFSSHNYAPLLSEPALSHPHLLNHKRSVR
jgi:hypothetical protein